MKAASPKTKQKLSKNKYTDTLPIVAIGASSGGLEAVTLLLQNVSPETGMAYVYIQHLSPDHKSILTGILAKVTAMKVQEAKDKVRMEPDNVYVISPDTEMLVTDGHIKLIPRPKGMVMPIDLFFTTLAEKHKENAIGII